MSMESALPPPLRCCRALHVQQEFMESCPCAAEIFLKKPGSAFHSFPSLCLLLMGIIGDFISWRGILGAEFPWEHLMTHQKTEKLLFYIQLSSLANYFGKTLESTPCFGILSWRNSLVIIKNGIFLIGNPTLSLNYGFILCSLQSNLNFRD